MRQSKANQSFQKSEQRRNQIHSIRSHTHTSSFIISPRRHLHSTPARLAGLDAIISFVVFEIYTLLSEAAAQPDCIADAVGLAWASQRARKTDRVVSLLTLPSFPLYRQPTALWPSLSGCGTCPAISRSHSAGLLLRLPPVATCVKCLVSDEAPLCAPGC